MKALVYDGAGNVSWTQMPEAVLIDDRDAIIRVDTAAICGTDLNIVRGHIPEVEAGRILGHEAVGTVCDVGRSAGLEVGDRVLASCISACGHCRCCRKGAYGQCSGGGGWILGHLTDGVQAEFARIPFADLSAYRVPDGVDDETAVLLADILPTAYEVGVLNGRVEPGDTVVVVGAGPVGLAAVLTVRLFSPLLVVAVDLSDNRLQAALDHGADVTVRADADPVGAIRELTGGVGADVAMEAVGAPETFELCTRLVGPAGRVANIGVHGRPAQLHLEDLWIRDVGISTGLVDTRTIPMLLSMISAGRLDVSRLVTRRFAFDQIVDAYRLFDNPLGSGALKIVLTPS